MYTIGNTRRVPKKDSCIQNEWQHYTHIICSNGQLLLLCYPQYYMTGGNSFISYYVDGSSNLDVTNLPSTANLFNTAIPGTNLATYYTFARLVGIELRATYIGAVETGAGETRIGLTNYTTLGAGSNIKNLIEDSDFYAADRAECTYKSIWLPQDHSDFKFRVIGDNGDADKATGWGAIMMASKIGRASCRERV